MMLSVILLFVFWAILFIMLRSYRPNFLTYAKSFGEFLVNFFVGNLPFLITLTVMYLNNQSFSDFIGKDGRPGQVLLYVCSFLAPVVFTFLINFRSAKLVWHVTYFVLILLCLLVGVLLFLDYGETQFTQNPRLDFIALTLYVVALSLWFFSIVYSRSLDEQNFSSDSGANGMINQVRKMGL